MTRRISVRIPTDLVEWIDQEVAEGRAASRSAVIERALRRYQEDREKVLRLLDEVETEHAATLKALADR